MIKYDRPVTLELSETDAAIIIKEDGTLEVSLPNFDTETVPENVWTGAAVLHALNTPEICQLIYQNFAQKCAQKVH